MSSMAMYMIENDLDPFLHSDHTERDEINPIYDDSPSEDIFLSENSDDIPISLTGSVVRLKSGGPLMTIQEEEDNNFVCRWFNGEIIKSASFNINEVNFIDNSPVPVKVTSGFDDDIPF